jgi:hypothetical protein
MTVRLAWAPNVAPNEADDRHLLADDERADLVETDAAVGLRHVDAEQAQVAAALYQPPRELPVFLFQLVEAPAGIRSARIPAPSVRSADVRR